MQLQMSGPRTGRSPAAGLPSWWWRSVRPSFDYPLNCPFPANQPCIAARYARQRWPTYKSQQTCLCRHDWGAPGEAGYGKPQAGECGKVRAGAQHLHGSPQPMDAHCHRQVGKILQCCGSSVFLLQSCRHERPLSKQSAASASLSHCDRSNTSAPIGTRSSWFGETWPSLARLSALPAAAWQWPCMCTTSLRCALFSPILVDS